MRKRNTTVRTWMQARRMEMFLVVWRTWKPAAMRGVTWLKAEFISREYGMPMIRCDGDVGNNERIVDVEIK